MRRLFDGLAAFMGNESLQLIYFLIGVVCGVAGMALATLTSASYPDYLQVLGLTVLALFALSTVTRGRRDDDVGVIICFLVAVGIALADAFGTTNGRFPGARLSGLWFALAVVLVIISLELVSNGAYPDSKKLCSEPATRRLARAVLMAAVSVAVIMLTLYGWDMWLDVVIVDACLAIAYIALRGSPQAQSGSAAQTAS